MVSVGREGDAVRGSSLSTTSNAIDASVCERRRRGNEGGRATRGGGVRVKGEWVASEGGASDEGRRGRHALSNVPRRALDTRGDVTPNGETETGNERERVERVERGERIGYSNTALLHPPLLANRLTPLSAELWSRARVWLHARVCDVWNDIHMCWCDRV